MIDPVAGLAAFLDAPDGTRAEILSRRPDLRSRLDAVLRSLVRPCGDLTGSCLYVGPHPGRPHAVGPDHPALHPCSCRRDTYRPDPVTIRREARRCVGCNRVVGRCTCEPLPVFGGKS